MPALLTFSARDDEEYRLFEGFCFVDDDKFERFKKAFQYALDHVSKELPIRLALGAEFISYPCTVKDPQDLYDIVTIKEIAQDSFRLVRGMLGWHAISSGTDLYDDFIDYMTGGEHNGL